MANPTTTPPGTPPGRMLKDGFKTRITFASKPNVRLWIKTAKPPGLDGGDAIEQTTMHNDNWRTFAPRSLKTLTEVKAKCAYNPAVYDQIAALINVEDSITALFPDGSTLDFFGFLQKFEPSDHEEGKQPEAEVTIRPTNWDYTNNVEAGPNYKTAGGTDTVIT